ncbi:MAG: DivIVA domain-containing protein [Nocardioides sp.]
MTQDQELFPYYRSPESIRDQQFTHRMRGLDEAEVYEYLDLLADQVRAFQNERAELRAEVERLQNAGPPPVQAETHDINPQAVILFSQAQQVADQLVEEAVRHARDLMTSARNQQREILQQAHEAAEAAVRESAAARADGSVTGYTTPVAEIEYVRTFAHVAQIQLRSVLDALTEQVDKLGEVPKLDSAPAPGQHVDAERLSIESWREFGSTVRP